MPYFHISSGLRGGYMPDNSYIFKCDTRRALRSIVENECDASREAYGYGGTKADITRIVALVWRESKPKARRPYLPYAIGFGRSRNANDRPFGVFISHATRAEYLEAEGSDE